MSRVIEWIASTLLWVCSVNQDLIHVYSEVISVKVSGLYSLCRSRESQELFRWRAERGIFSLSGARLHPKVKVSRCLLPSFPPLFNCASGGAGWRGGNGYKRQSFSPSQSESLLAAATPAIFLQNLGSGGSTDSLENQVSGAVQLEQTICLWFTLLY